MKKLLFSLFDYSGNSSEPYRQDPNWDVLQVDIKHKLDIMNWDFEQAYKYHNPCEVGIILMPPCTDYALSGARYFAVKDADGRTERSQKILRKCKTIISFFDSLDILTFWQLENPMSRIHTLNPWLGKPILKFNPCDFAGYSSEPESDRYNKATWLWGDFKIPEKKHLEPLYKENPGWKKLGGKSERTKELRSVTPKGFCTAFYLFNK